VRFGKTYGEDTSTSDDSQPRRDYIRYFKKPNTEFRILQDPEEWVTYWEHYNPGGFPFPCTGERSTCPGCTSSNEKMKRASKRVAINVLEGDWVNVYKFPITVADKLADRAQRIGTLKDRNYLISKLQSKNPDGSTKTDYDIEGQDKIPMDLSGYELKDPELLLAQAYEESWGNGQATETVLKADDDQKQSALKVKVKEAEKPKEEPKTYTEEELRAMDLSEILQVCKNEGIDEGEMPQTFMHTNEVVDWLLTQ
jgi:hypothetical protein